MIGNIGGQSLAGLIFGRITIESRKASRGMPLLVASRAEALEQLKSKPYDKAQIEDDKQYVAKKLEISLDELEEILDRPAKWFWDYPNDNRKLTFVYNTYRKLFNTEKLSSS